MIEIGAMSLQGEAKMESYNFQPFNTYNDQLLLSYWSDPFHIPDIH